MIPDRHARAARIAALVLAALLLDGCAGVQRAPVEERAGANPAPASVYGETIAGVDGTPPAPGVQVNALPDSGPSDAAAPTASGAGPAPARAAPRQATAAPANPAVVALLNRANSDTRAGRHGPAAASLERALKIEPGNPWLWHRLAVARLAQGRAGEAASLAARSSALAGADNGLRADNWRLIARVHRERGEDVAARAAERRARELMNPAS